VTPTTIPILRSFDEAKMREFYVDFLGFEVVWEHRFDPDLPLYCEVRRAGCVLHLSEHHGDATPGARVRILDGDVDAYQAELIAKRYKNNRPGMCDQPYGTREMQVNDPFGNGLVFYRFSDGRSSA